MTSLDLARWQFGLTTLLHFAIVGVSIGLVFFVALLQTRYHRTGEERWLRLTKYYGRAMVIVFAVGVVTGLMQTFQFGMNWAGFSRYVGDVFGAPLALEGSAAFFVESVFLGLWIFGAGKLRPRVHLACLWVLSAATMISAYSILVANSWMQNPVGYEIVDGRAQLTDIFAVMVNWTVGLTFAHVLFTSLMTGAVVVLGIACVQIARGREVAAFGGVARMAVFVGLGAALAAAGAGHFQGVLALEQQPMKMAAAEAHYETEAPAGSVAVRPRQGRHRPRPAVPEHQGARGAFVPEFVLAEQRGARDRAAPSGSRGAVRARRLHAGGGAHVLELPPDGGWRRGADRAARAGAAGSPRRGGWSGPSGSCGSRRSRS